MAKKKNKVNSEVNLVSALLRLIEKNVPAMVLWQHKGNLKKLGTGNMMCWFDGLDDSVKTSLKSNMVQDMVSLSNNTDELLTDVETVPVMVRASSLYKSTVSEPSSSGMPFLPFPLSVMNKKQKSKFISDQIAVEAKNKEGKLVYGSEAWRPSFWPEHIWNWANLNKSLSKITEEEFSGVGTYSEFLETVIKILLERENKDPESHVENLSEKTRTIKMKKRAKGIHTAPSIVNAVKNIDIEKNPDTVSEITDSGDFVGSSAPDDQSFDELNSVQSQTPVQASLPSAVYQSSGVHQSSAIPPSATDAAFKPRRGVGKSPFKTAGVKSKPVRVQMGIFEEIEPEPVEVPADVKQQLKRHCMAEAHKVKWNSGGGSCLFKAAVQHINSLSYEDSVSYLELRRYTHLKIVEWWDNFKSYFSWPMDVTIGTGDSSIVKSITSESEFKEFLLSDESMESYNETEVELWTLSYILNCNISVLAYNLPSGQGEGGSRCKWKFFDGYGIVPGMPDNSLFLCYSSEFLLLNEHTVHWYLVEGCEAPPSLPDDADLITADIEVSSMATPSSQEKEQPVQDMMQVQSLSCSPGDKTREADISGSFSAVDSNCSKLSSNDKISSLKPQTRHVDDPSQTLPLGGAALAKKIGKFQPKTAHKRKKQPMQKIQKNIHMKGTTLKITQQKLVNKKDIKQNQDADVNRNDRTRSGIDCIDEMFNSDQENAVSQPGGSKSVVARKIAKRKIVHNTSEDEVISKLEKIEVIGNADGFKVKDMMKNRSDKAIAMKSDMYHIFKVKEHSVEEALKVPEASDVAKEAALDALDQQIKEQTQDHELKMLKADNFINKEKNRQKLMKKKFKENAVLRNKIEAELTVSQIEEMFEKNKKFLIAIKASEGYSARHKDFFKGGAFKIALNEKVYVASFSDVQVDFIMSLMEKNWARDLKEQMENSDYLWKVLLPEFLIKVYSEFFVITEIEAVERMSKTPVHAKDQSDDSDSNDS